MNKERRKEIEAIRSQLDEAVSAINAAKDSLED